MKSLREWCDEQFGWENVKKEQTVYFLNNVVDLFVFIT